MLVSVENRSTLALSKGAMVTMESTANEFLTLEEAARRKEVSVGTIRRRIASGELPAYVDNQDRKRRLVTAADLDRTFLPTLIKRDELAVTR